MCGLWGVPGTPSQPCSSGAGHRSRSRPFPARALSGTALAGLVLLSAWLPAGTAEAASYPPALGCAVEASAAAGTGVTVHGMGFRAGSPVLVSIAGRRAGRTVADSAGSFAVAWPLPTLPAGGTLRAAGPGCSATGRLTIEDRPGTPLPPREPSVTAIPVARLTGLPPQLFLGLAGAVLLAGAALTGLAGRLGHRAEGRSSSATTAAGRLPALGGPRLTDAPPDFR